MTEKQDADDAVHVFDQTNGIVTRVAGEWEDNEPSQSPEERRKARSYDVDPGIGLGANIQH